MLNSLIELFLGCQHAKLTFPQSPRREGPLNRFQRQGAAHVTCLGCGRQFSYDWKAMRVGKRICETPARVQSNMLDQEAL